MRPVREAFEPYPGGLAPPSPRPISDEQIDTALEACGPEARVVLERLLWSPTGAVRTRRSAVTVTSASSPIERLLSRQLLRPLDSETVIIPREVAWRLRGARFMAEPVATEPAAISGRRPRNPDLVDRAAAGAAFALLHDIELVAQHIESVPHRLLRGGGLGSRDVAALAQHLGADPAHAAFVVECAAAARLVAPAKAAALLPTADYDKWLGSRCRHSAGGKSPRHGSPPTVSLPDPAKLAATRSARRRTPPPRPGLRITVLRLVAEAEPGTVLDLDQLADAATWHRPRLSQGPLTAQQLVRWTWREASWLGLAALDAVSSLARVPLQPGQPMPTELTELFPAPVTRFVIQTDLTAVTAGPLEHDGCRTSCGCWLIRSHGVVVASIASAPARCAAPSTWVGRRRMCSFGWNSIPQRMCPRPFATWSATWLGTMAAFESARPVATSGWPTRHRRRRCSLIPLPQNSGSAPLPREFWSQPSMRMSWSRCSGSSATTGDRE